MVLLQRELYFPKNPEGDQHFPGGSNFFQGGGGGPNVIFFYLSSCTPKPPRRTLGGVPLYTRS